MKIFTHEDNINNIYFRLEDDGIVIIADEKENAKNKVKELLRYLEDKNEEDFWNDDFEARIEVSHSTLPHKNGDVAFVFNKEKYKPLEAAQIVVKEYEEQFDDQWEETEN